MIRIEQLRHKCVGCYACVEANPQRWRVSRKDGKSILIGGVQKGQFFSTTTSDDEWGANERAAMNCPVKIIVLSQK